MSTQKSKGKVAIENVKGWLRLRWRVEGKQYSFRLGLMDSNANRIVAESKANQIYLDVISGNFDPSLVKYKGAPPPPKSEVKLLSLLEAFDAFCKVRFMSIDSRSREKYLTLRKQLEAYYSDRTFSAIAKEDVEGFWFHLEEIGLSLRTRKEKAVLLSAFGKWAVQEKLRLDNPWEGMSKWLRVPAPAAPKPFTTDEMQSILTGFKVSHYYAHYYSFVLFCFGTGVRIAEAIGLQWKHLSEDCSTIVISESLSRGVRKPTKTNRARTFRLSSSISQMLQEMKPIDASPEDLVFKTANGNPINDKSFRNRAWVNVLQERGVLYRKPYVMRATFISHALAGGMSPMMVSQITGHDPQVMFKHYAGVIESTPKAPDITVSV
jgi:integrase